MKKNIRAVIAAITLIAVIVVTGCTNTDDPGYETYSDTTILLDTVVTVSIYAGEEELGEMSDTPENIIKSVFDEIARLESVLAVEYEGSDLDALSAAAGADPVKVSDETLEVLERSKYYTDLSRGLFDVTAGPLIDLWNIKDGTGHVPSEDELASVLPLIDSGKMELGEDTAFLKEKGMKANLGAIAKGYIGDRARDLVTSSGVRSAVIALGGNIIVIGSKPDGTPFSIGVQDPKKPTGEILGIIEASDISIVSSGDNERFFEEDGVKYHHILDPKTGYPGDSGLSGVTILCDDSVDGDGLSTSVFLMGLEDGKALIESLEGVEAIFVTSEGEVVTTSGLTGFTQV